MGDFLLRFDEALVVLAFGIKRGLVFLDFREGIRRLSAVRRL